MSCNKEKDILGNWKLANGQGTLNIEKLGETYKCTWSIEEEDHHHEYLGIGIFVNNKLFVSRYSKKVPMAGVGMYKPIGDFRSNSALWASTQNFDTLGSGIAIRQETNEGFEGDYKVRYFIKEYESPIFDLKIIKKKQNDNLYDLTWSIHNKVQLHGVGIIHNEQMFLAYGGIDFQYEVVILSNVNENELNSKGALITNSSINDEIYIR